MNIIAKNNSIKNLYGIFWMILGAFCLSIVSVLSNLVSNEVSTIKLFFFGSVFAFISLILHGLITRPCKSYEFKLNKKELYYFVLRGLFNTIGMLLWFSALDYIYVTEATAISYVTPVLNIFGAIIILREKVNVKKILALITSLIGIIIVLKPGFQKMHIGVVLALLAAFFWSANDIIAKIRITSHSTYIHCFYMLLFMVLFTFPFVIKSLHAIPMWELKLIALIGAFMYLNLHFVFKAYKMGHLTTIMPFDFCRFIFTSAISIYFFDEILNNITTLGIGIIFLSTTYLCYNQYKFNFEGKEC